MLLRKSILKPQHLLVGFYWRINHPEQQTLIIANHVVYQLGNSFRVAGLAHRSAVVRLGASGGLSRDSVSSVHMVFHPLVSQPGLLQWWSQGAKEQYFSIL